MTGVTIILIVVCIGLGFYGGYRWGIYYVSKENNTLRNQLVLQERFSRTWAAEATDKYTLSQKVAWQQTQNLDTLMLTVIQTLSMYQNQNAGRIDQKKNEKVSELIAKAKSVAALHE